ncbi:MAG: recombination protein O N-terminal domain-containing protein, partial [Desulfobacterales bacterium]
MSSFSTPAIVLRRIDYGEYDFVITLFTLRNGKVSVIAKSAKK